MPARVDRDWAAIRADWRDGMSAAEVAAKYGFTSKQSVSNAASKMHMVRGPGRHPLTGRAARLAAVAALQAVPANLPPKREKGDHWTEERRQLFRRMYPDPRFTREEIAEAVGLRAEVLGGYAAKMGLTRPKSARGRARKLGPPELAPEATSAPTKASVTQEADIVRLHRRRVGLTAIAVQVRLPYREVERILRLAGELTEVPPLKEKSTDPAERSLARMPVSLSVFPTGAPS